MRNPTSALRPLPSVLRPPTSAGRPLTSDLRLPSSVFLRALRGSVVNVTFEKVTVTFFVTFFSRVFPNKNPSKRHLLLCYLEGYAIGAFS